MFIRLRQPRSLAQLTRPLRPVSQLRPHFRIAVVDNDAFEPAEQMRSHGFVLQELGDIADLAAISSYPIVACDISGVGVAFGSPLGGAHVVAEIRKRYPDKYIIAYSGGRFGAEYKKSLDASDVFIRRGSPAQEWVGAFDSAIAQVGDPIDYWVRLRQVLLSQGLSTFEVMLLEDAYVRAIEKKDEFILSKALRKARRKSEAASTLDQVADGAITVVKLALHLS